MIPNKNKKKTLEVTVEEMRKFSFSYLEKYSPSKQQLKTYLLKKYLKKGTFNIKKQDVVDLIDVVSVISFILQTAEPADSQFWAADVNGDGSLDILDVVTLVDWILNN